MSGKFSILIFMIILWNPTVQGQDCPPADTLEVIPVQNEWDMPVVNDWSGLEVLTWNIKFFPQSELSDDYINEILYDLQPDIVVLQEIDDLASFTELAASMPAYQFIHTDYESIFGYENLDLGLAVRSDCIEILDQQLLFQNHSWDFAGRPPLKADLRWHCGDVEMDFQIINVHFKCCSDGFDRRRSASLLLHNYIIDEENNGAENILIAGDFNDQIDEPENENSLWPLVNDPENMLFATLPIAGDEYYESFPWGFYHSLIDHVLISSGFFDENEGSTVFTFRPDDYMGVNSYQTHVSDHRPVIWKISPQFVYIPQGLVITEIMNNPAAVSDSYGEWFEVKNTGSDSIQLNGIILSDENNDTHTIQSSDPLIILPGAYFLFGREGNPALNGGITPDYVYSGFNLNNSWDEVVIRHPSGVILDEVNYDNGETFPDPEGASMMLTDTSSDNMDGSNWSVSTVPMADGDFGTPGYSNSGVINCDHDGNVNSDDLTDVSDLVMIVGFILETIPLSEEQQCHGDRNSDGILDILDLVQIIDDILNP